METKQIIRLILASPGDVQTERDATALVIDQINHELRDWGRSFIVELWRWETDAHPGMHAEGPQGLIDECLQIEEGDILVGIFGKRFGTPVKGAGSGTEYEVRRAIGLWQLHRSPQVLLYFKKNPGVLSSLQEKEQHTNVVAFKAELEAQGNNAPLLWTFSDVDDYSTHLRSHLRRVLAPITEANVLMGSSPLQFEVTTVPVHLRSEGMTELVDEIFLKCTCNPDSPPLFAQWFSVRVLIGTNITSRLMLDAGSAVTADMVLFEVGRPSSKRFYRSKVIANMASFDQIELDNIEPGETRTFQISNLRCCAAALGSGQEQARVMANISVAGFHTPVQTIAFMSQGLRFETRNVDGTVGFKEFTRSHKLGLTPTRICILHFEEGFPHAFKTRGLVGPDFSRQIGQAYLSESSAFGQVIQMVNGQVRSTGSADYGTRIAAHFDIIPEGVRLYTSYSHTPRSTIHAHLIEASSTAYPTPHQIDGTEAREIILTNGSATAVWEIDSASPLDRIGFLDFVIYASWDIDPKTNRPLLGTGVVREDFWPCPPYIFTHKSGSAASVDLPIPRFTSRYVSRNLLKLD